MRALAVAAALVVLAGMRAGAVDEVRVGARKIVLSSDLSVEELVPGIWLHESWAEIEGFGRSPANGLVIAGQGEAAQIGTPWNDG
jgi:hypothetical protein